MKKQKTNKERSNFMQAFVNALTIVILLGEVALFYVILRFNVLPEKYSIPALVVTALISVAAIAWLRKSKGKASKVIAFLLAIALIIGVTQISYIRSLIGKIAGAESELHTM